MNCPKCHGVGLIKLQHKDEVTVPCDCGCSVRRDLFLWHDATPADQAALGCATFEEATEALSTGLIQHIEFGGCSLGIGLKVAKWLYEQIDASTRFYPYRGLKAVPTWKISWGHEQKSNEVDEMMKACDNLLEIRTKMALEKASA